MPINKNKIKIGELLVQAKIITEEQLQLALKYQKEKGGKLGSIIVSMGLATEDSLLTAMSQQLNIPFLDLAHYKIDSEVVRKIPERIARRFRVLALEKKENKYIVGMVEPTDLLALDQIESMLGASLQIVLVNESGVLNVINNVYRRTEDIASFAKELTEELSKEKIAFRSNEENVVGDDASPVARLLDSIFEDAMQVGASDVHIEPEANLVRIRQRVDGL